MTSGGEVASGNETTAMAVQWIHTLALLTLRYVTLLMPFLLVHLLY